MSLGLNLGMMGRTGGVLGPVQDDLLQQIYAYNADGTYEDKAGLAVPVASPEATSTNIVSYDGATNYSTAQVGVAGLTDTATVHFTFRCDSSVASVYFARLGNYYWRVTNATTLTVYPDNGSGTAFTVPTISVGEFNTLTYKINGTSTSLYIDGAFVIEKTTSEAELDAIGGIFRIGYGATYGDVSFGNAVVWDRELTDIEIAGLPNLDYPVSGMVCGYTCGDGEGELYDISDNDYAMTDAGTIELTTADGLVNWFLLKGGRRSSDAYSATEPTGGWLREFDPLTATQGQLFDFIATLVNDARYGWQTYTITPGYTPLRTYDPNTSSINDLYDVAGTLGDDLPSTANAYTLTAPTTNLYTFDPNTDGLNEAYDVLGTLLIDLQTYGVIG